MTGRLVTSNALAPGGSPSQLVSRLATGYSSADDVMVVGHEPIPQQPNIRPDHRRPGARGAAQEGSPLQAAAPGAQVRSMRLDRVVDDTQADDKSGMTQDTPSERNFGWRQPVSLLAARAVDRRLKRVARLLPRAARHPERDVEYVHDLRVASRRAAATLRLFEPWLPQAASAKMQSPPGPNPQGGRTRARPGCDRREAVPPGGRGRRHRPARSRHRPCTSTPRQGPETHQAVLQKSQEAEVAWTTGTIAVGAGGVARPGSRTQAQRLGRHRPSSATPKIRRPLVRRPHRSQGRCTG